MSMMRSSVADSGSRSRFAHPATSAPAVASSIVRRVIFVDCNMTLDSRYIPAAMPALLRLVFIVVACVATQLYAATTSAPTVTAADLPRVPATEPQDAIRTFKVRPGFEMQLVACEPQIVDPIAISFDEN